MKRSALFCIIVFITLLSAGPLQADDVVLTLDLSNTYADEARSGGIWQLYARRVETSKDPQGEAGIASIRALINNIRSHDIKFASNIGQMTTGGPFVNTLPSGTVEILYQQDTDGTVVNGVGVAKQPQRDQLIASGSWPPGPRPNFGDDGATPTPATSSAKFLGVAQAAFPTSVAAGETTTVVVTLGDLDDDGQVTNSDTAPFVARLPGAEPALPYHPAADLDQSGTITAEDRELYISIMSLE